MTIKGLEKLVTRHDQILQDHTSVIAECKATLANRTATLADHTTILAEIMTKLDVLLQRSESFHTPLQTLPLPSFQPRPPPLTPLTSELLLQKDNIIPSTPSVASFSTFSSSPTPVIITVTTPQLKQSSVVTTIMDGRSLPSSDTCSYISADLPGYQFTTAIALVFDFIPERHVHSDCMTGTPVRIFEETFILEDASAIRIWFVPWKETKLQPEAASTIRIWLVPWEKEKLRLKGTAAIRIWFVVKPCFEGAGMMGYDPNC